MSDTPLNPPPTRSQEEIFARLRSIVNIYHKAFKNFAGVYISTPILRSAVERYFLELDWGKAFHGSEFADQHKRAALSAFWIAKLRPVQLHTNANVTDALLIANEWFAIHAAFAHLEIEVSAVSAPYLRNLIYTLRYRSPDPETLASVVYLLERACLKLDP